MLEPFQRLSQNFAPVEDVQGLALPANTRQLKTWIDELPRGNPKETATMLYIALAKSLSEKLSGATRFHMLEEVRQVTVDSITWLERQFVGTALPLMNERLAFAQSALNLHVALADGYRLATYEICSPNGAIPMLKGAVVLAALERSLWHYQQSLIICWKLYRSNVKNVWLGIHRIYQFAKHLKVDKKSIDDPLMGESVSIHDLYCKMALVSLINPLAFAQSEQENLYKLAAGFAPQCMIGVNQLTEQWLKLPIDADLPVDSNLPDTEVMYFNAQDLSNAVNAVDENSDAESIDLALADGKHITVPVNILIKVKRAMGMTLARSFTRQFTRYPIETIIGFNPIHYYVAGGLDFENFIHQLPQTSVNGLTVASEWLGRPMEATIQRPILAEVINHSLAGYRIMWANEASLRVRVGEVIGLNVMKPEPDWMVGMIRWLQYEQNGSIIAGVELLTRRCHPVALSIQKANKTNAVVRGLQLEPMEEQLPVKFLMSGRQPNHNQKLDVYYSYEPNRIGDARTIESIDSKTLSFASNMEYSLLAVV